jgi:hypothetical protein
MELLEFYKKERKNMENTNLEYIIINGQKVPIIKAVRTIERKNANGGTDIEIIVPRIDVSAIKT